MLTPASQIAVVGFGDGSRRFAAALAPRGCALRIHDPEAAMSADAAHARARIEALGVDVAADLPAAMRGARLVVLDCAAAGEVHALLQPGQILLDLEAGPAQHGASAAAQLVGRFEACAATRSEVLRIAGTDAAKLAQALSAIGLPSEAAPPGWQPSHGRPQGDSGPLADAQSAQPVVRRGELP